MGPCVHGTLWVLGCVIHPETSYGRLLSPEMPGLQMSSVRWPHWSPGATRTGGCCLKNTGVSRSAPRGRAQCEPLLWKWRRILLGHWPSLWVVQRQFGRHDAVQSLGYGPCAVLNEGKGWISHARSKQGLSWTFSVISVFSSSLSSVTSYQG